MFIPELLKLFIDIRVNRYPGTLWKPIRFWYVSLELRRSEDLFIVWVQEYIPLNVNGPLSFPWLPTVVLCLVCGRCRIPGGHDPLRLLSKSHQKDAVAWFDGFICYA